MTEQSEKERQIAAAALRVFSRYGLKRATMNDIAEEAGVVRQTLYNVFANKDEVIHGTLLFYTAALRESVRDAWAGQDDLATRLDLLFEHYVIASWDAVRATPDAGALEEGTHAAANSAMVHAEAAMVAMLVELFAPYEAQLKRNGHGLHAFAEYLSATLMALKHQTGDRDALIRHLGTLKSMTLMAAT
ncbi:TetR/AcrR family transcriptional regulator [Gymnodinialimonas sp.]